MTCPPACRAAPPDRRGWRLLLWGLLAVLLLACAGPPLRSERPRGVYHRVKAGETLSAIARAYRVDLQELAEINNLPNPSQIEVDHVLFVPDAAQIVDEVIPAGKGFEAPAGPAALPPAAAKAGAKTAEAPKAGSLRAGGAVPAAPGGPPKVSPEEAPSKARKPPPREKRETEVSAAVRTGPPPAPPAVERPGPGERQELKFDKGRFAWPVKGKVISPFGMQPNRMYFNGIRIAAPGGSAVVAAAPGTVIFSAPLKDYGETIILKHADQYATVYSHLGTRTVGAEVQVKRGDRIAFLAGTPPEESYLHFEIRHQNKARNPIFFLP